MAKHTNMFRDVSSWLTVRVGVVGPEKCVELVLFVSDMSITCVEDIFRVKTFTQVVETSLRMNNTNPDRSTNHNH